MSTDQIAAEALLQFEKAVETDGPPLDSFERSQFIESVKSAIEKAMRATESRCAGDMAEMVLNHPQRPTPATASEKGCTCDTTGEICRPSHDCPIHGIDKPDPATASETQKVVNGPVWSAMMEEQERTASAGKYKHEYADHLPATDATDHAATPSGGREWTPDYLHSVGIFTTEQMCAAHNAALRDCGNDTKRVLGLLLEVYNEHMHFGWGYEELHDKIIDELNTANMLPVIAIDAAMLETGEQTKEKE